MPSPPPYTPPTDVPEGIPASLRGGWQALLAKKRAEHKDKPQVKDQAAQILDLVRTPTTYTAWHPEATATDPSAVAKAKSALEKAEKEFSDDDKTPEKGGEKKPKSSFLQIFGGDEDYRRAFGPWSMLQTSSVVSHRTAQAQAASMVLEQFASSLGSTPIFRLAKMPFNLEKLTSILLQMQEAESSADFRSREASAEAACSKFKSEAAAKARQEAERREQEARAAQEEQAKTELLQRELLARERIVQVLDHAYQSLTILGGQLKESQDELLQHLKHKAKALMSRGSKQLAELMETLGRLEGLEEAGSLELQDAVDAAAARRLASEEKSKQVLEEIKGKLAAVQSSWKMRQNLASQMFGGTPSLLEVEQDSDMQKHFTEMCEVTRQQTTAKHVKREGEKAAIRAAIAVMSD